MSETKSAPLIPRIPEQEMFRVSQRAMQHWPMASISQLLPAIAHEIKNPLAGMQSIVEVLQEELESAQHKEDLQFLLQELSRLRFIIDRMTLVEPNILHSENPVDLCQVAQRALKLTRARCSHLGIQVIFTSEQLNLWARINPESFHIILLNLLNNAMDACKQGDTITVSLEMVQEQTVKLLVRDTGRGMSLEVKQRTTEPFYTTKCGGSGIGLSLIHDLVGRCGGSLHIWSLEDQGTTVTVLLQDR